MEDILMVLTGFISALIIITYWFMIWFIGIIVLLLIYFIINKLWKENLIFMLARIFWKKVIATDEDIGICTRTTSYYYRGNIYIHKHEVIVDFKNLLNKK